MRPIVLGTISIDQVAGGLEKNIVWLSNHLAKNGCEVHLVTFDFDDSRSFYELENTVVWHKVGCTTPHTRISFSNRSKLIGNIRSVLTSLKQPIVICFHHGILPRFYLAGMGLNIDFIGSERNSLTLYDYVRQKKWTLGFLMLVMCRRISVQFESYRKDYPYWLRSRIRVINNPVAYREKKLAKPESPGKDGRYKIIHVGRLCAQKNQALLLSAFSKIVEQFPEWDLHFIGDGGLESSLLQRIDEYGLHGRVFIQGKRNDVDDWLEDSNIFCLPSQWEGFPNALAEAMAIGLPCIGLRSCAGVCDLIEHGENGYLAEESKLHQLLAILMSEAKLRAKMGASSRSIIRQYTPERSFSLWDSLLDEISHKL